MSVWAEINKQCSKYRYHLSAEHTKQIELNTPSELRNKVELLLVHRLPSLPRPSQFAPHFNLSRSLSPSHSLLFERAKKFAMKGLFKFETLLLYTYVH